MGCDGGTIPRRDELVRLKKKPEQKDKAADLAAKWKHCAISQQSLQLPIVACELGRLYKKDVVIEYLLDSSSFECAGKFDYIRSLKDVKELQLTENTEFRHGAEKGDGYIDNHTSQYICPVTGLEMSGRYKFCYLHGCGCVFSEKALKEVKSETCNKCGKGFSKDDVIILNGSDEEVEELRKRMTDRKAKAKLEKKTKRKHKAEAAAGSAAEASSSKIAKLASEKPSTSQTNDDTKKKLILPSKLTNGKKEETAPKFKCIQDDPSASSAYKSLFNTCEKAKRQTKAHWVTHNPLYY